MMCVLTEWNACRGGLFDMLCVVWVGQTCIIYHRMRTDAPFYILTPPQFLHIVFHRTNYGLHEPMLSAMRQFNEVIGLFDFGLTRDQFLNHLRLTL
jgi:hypothetical protein